jgi:hypothetical protein
MDTWSMYADLGNILFPENIERRQTNFHILLVISDHEPR